MADVKIIGLSGTNGSGKDVVATMLAERYGYLAASATEMLAAELQTRGWPIDREHKSKLSAEWRRKDGFAAIVNRAYAMFEASPGKYHGLAVGSLRHPAEADRVHELGGTMLWLDGDPKIRYERISKHAIRPGREKEDGKSFEEWLADEEREMHPTGDAATLNGSAVKERADVIVLNNENDIPAFLSKVQASLKLS